MELVKWLERSDKPWHIQKNAWGVTNCQSNSMTPDWISLQVFKIWKNSLALLMMGTLKRVLQNCAAKFDAKRRFLPFLLMLLVPFYYRPREVQNRCQVDEDRVTRIRLWSQHVITAPCAVHWKVQKKLRQLHGAEVASDRKGSKGSENWGNHRSFISKSFLVIVGYCLLFGYFLGKKTDFFLG